MFEPRAKLCSVIGCSHRMRCRADMVQDSTRRLQRRVASARYHPVRADVATTEFLYEPMGWGRPRRFIAVRRPVLQRSRADRVGHSRAQRGICARQDSRTPLGSQRDLLSTGGLRVQPAQLVPAPVCAARPAALVVADSAQSAPARTGRTCPPAKHSDAEIAPQFPPPESVLGNSQACRETFRLKSFFTPDSGQEDYACPLRFLRGGYFPTGGKMNFWMRLFIVSDT
jgi:hypothetical protein